MPVLVGFIPTFLMVTTAFGTIAPATKKNAADEISPEIISSFGDNSDFFSVLSLYLL